MSELPALSATETLMQREQLERMEAALLEMPQIEFPVTHRFAPGLYIREVFVPAGAVIVGHEHKAETLNILLQGAALVAHDGKVEELIAPLTFNSAPGVRKAAVVLEDMVWINVHPNPTNETDPAKLEDMFIVRSDGFLEAQRQLELLKEARKQ
ncbi:MAG: hypothetical protein NTU84_00645 [Verrucomicrobia bacterium]|nr:hypothetical protein [Verrucomicrobiota bacterium]